jgi:serine/threonine protein kinase
MHQLDGLKICVNVHFLSPAIAVKTIGLTKTNFTIDGEGKKNCEKHGHLRYMVMEKAGNNMFDMIRDNRGPISLPEAVWFTIKLIEKIASMHARGIVHGDIHPGNIVLADEDIRLIDFGTAIFDSEINPTQLVRKPYSYIHCLMSHWNLGGHGASYRDDVFKALFVGAFLMNGYGYMDYCKDLETNGYALMQFKRDSFLFTYPGGPDVISNIGIWDPEKSRVKNHLISALYMARNVIRPTDIPNYEKINNELRQILAITGLGPIELV